VWVFRVIVPVQNIDAASIFYRALLGADGERVTSGATTSIAMASCWLAGIRSPTGTLACSPAVLTVQAAVLCSACSASSQVLRTSAGVR